MPRSVTLLPSGLSTLARLMTNPQLLRDAANNQPRVLIEPAPEVQIKGFGESGIDLILTAWIPDPEEGTGGLQSAIFLEIWRSFQKHAILIPYPHREVRILGNPPA